MRCSCYQPFIANFMTNIVTCSSFIRKIDNETEYGSFGELFRKHKCHTI